MHAESVAYVKPHARDQQMSAIVCEYRGLENLIVFLFCCLCYILGVNAWLALKENSVRSTPMTALSVSARMEHRASTESTRTHVLAALVTKVLMFLLSWISKCSSSRGGIVRE